MQCMLDQFIIILGRNYKPDLFQPPFYPTECLDHFRINTFDILMDTLMRHKGQIHLLFFPAVCQFAHILQNLHILCKILCFMSFYILTEFIKDDINAGISVLCTKHTVDLFIDPKCFFLHHWIENTSGCQYRVKFFEF